MIPTGPLHPALLAAAVAVGMVAGPAARWWAARSPTSPATRDAIVVLGAVAAVVVLVVDHRVPGAVVAAVAVALVGGARRDPGPGERAGVAAAVIVCTTVGLAPLPTSTWLLLTALAVLLAAGSTTRRTGARCLPVAAAAVAATWAGAPDTEVAVAVGGVALGAVASAAASTRAIRSAGRPDGAGRSATPAVDGRAGWWVLLVWAAADGYRGRPGGMWGAVIPLLALAAWIALDARGTAPSRWRLVLGWLLVGGVAAVAARTVGTEHALGARPGLVVALVAAACASALVGLAGKVRSPGGARTPPA